MLKEIPGKEGLFRMLGGADPMPFEPAELDSRQPFLGTFGHFQTEEAVRILVQVCQEAGSWCGIAGAELLRRMGPNWQFLLDCRCIEVLDGVVFPTPALLEPLARFRKAA